MLNQKHRIYFIEIKDFIFPKIFIIISYMGQLLVFIVNNLVKFKGSKL
jgi:hypothetical protein